ncbi:MAG: hypothetical protein PVF34_13420 [Gammaproteobacteria bacterium]|nr:hypothetical protein [Gammaproteobacteria bacterium]
MSDYSRQNQWLARNYPDRAAHFDRLPADHASSPASVHNNNFRDDIIAGQVRLGMTVDEVLIAADTTPYGPKPYKGKFWCNNQAVSHCDANCQACEGLIFLQDQVVWFSGNFQAPTVVHLDHSRQQSIFTATPPVKIRIAEALYRNEIIQGMSMHQVNRILVEQSVSAHYYCDSTPLQFPMYCQTDCTVCKIEISDNGSPGQTVFLKQDLGEYRVVRVEK